MNLRALRIAGFALATLAAATAANATTVTDPTGDGGSGPDIISMSGTYNTTTLFLSVRFATGTFDPSGTPSGLLIGLNLDPAASPPTGCCTDPSVFFPLGADYSLFYVHSNGGAFRLSSFSSGSGSFVANITPTFVTDGVDLSIALSLVGGDGLLYFGAVAGTDNNDGSFAPEDFLVDDGQIRQGPTEFVPSAVPLPVTLPLFASGLGALGLIGLRSRKRKAAVLAA